MRGFRCLALLMLSVSLAACSTGPRRGAPAPVTGSGSVSTADGVQTAPAAELPAFTPLPKPERRAPNKASASPAVVALLSGAERKRGEGDLDAAVASLERALRIEPRNALLWHRLASIRFDQKRYRSAIDLAARSNSLARGEPGLRGANRRLMERARSRMANR